jgi:hypothetical protein
VPEIGDDRAGVDPVVYKLVGRCRGAKDAGGRVDVLEADAGGAFSILRKPLAVIGAPRSVINTCRPGCSFCSRRKALISTPESGCGLL